MKINILTNFNSLSLQAENQAESFQLKELLKSAEEEGLQAAKWYDWVEDKNGGITFQIQSKKLDK